MPPVTTNSHQLSSPRQKELLQQQQTQPISPRKKEDMFQKTLHPDVPKLRELLSNEYPESEQLYSDCYLSSVLSVPDRSLSKSFQKLSDALKWRRVYGVNELKRTDFEQQLNTCSLYWHGYDRKGHPILWVKPKLKNYKNLNVQKEIQMHIFMIEEGIKNFMPPGISTFVLVSDTCGLGIGDFDLELMKGLLNVVTQGYPDRLEALYAGPVNMFVTMMYKVLYPLLPARLSSKVHLMSKPNKELNDIVSLDDIPEFFKGPSVHPTFKDSKGYFSYEEMKAIQLQLKPKKL